MDTSHANPSINSLLLLKERIIKVEILLEQHASLTKKFSDLENSHIQALENERKAKKDAAKYLEKYCKLTQKCSSFLSNIKNLQGTLQEKNAELEHYQNENIQLNSLVLAYKLDRKNYQDLEKDRDFLLSTLWRTFKGIEESKQNKKIIDTVFKRFEKELEELKLGDFRNVKNQRIPSGKSDELATSAHNPEVSVLSNVTSDITDTDSACESVQSVLSHGECEYSSQSGKDKESNDSANSRNYLETLDDDTVDYVSSEETASNVPNVDQKEKESVGSLSLSPLSSYYLPDVCEDNVPGSKPSMEQVSPNVVRSVFQETEILENKLPTLDEGVKNSSGTRKYPGKESHFHIVFNSKPQTVDTAFNIDCSQTCREDVTLDANIVDSDVTDITDVPSFYYHASEYRWMNEKDTAPLPLEGDMDNIKVQDVDCGQQGERQISKLSSMFDIPDCEKQNGKSDDNDLVVEDLEFSSDNSAEVKNVMCEKNMEDSQTCGRNEQDISRKDELEPNTVNRTTDTVNNTYIEKNTESDRFGVDEDEEVRVILERVPNVRLVSPLHKSPRRHNVSKVNDKKCNKQLFNSEPAVPVIVTETEGIGKVSVTEKSVQTDDLGPEPEVIKIKQINEDNIPKTLDTRKLIKKICREIWNKVLKKKFEKLDQFSKISKSQSFFLSLMKMLFKFMNDQAVNYQNIKREITNNYLRKKERERRERVKLKAVKRRKAPWKVENLEEPVTGQICVNGNGMDVIKSSPICNYFMNSLESPESVNSFDWCISGREFKFSVQKSNDFEGIPASFCMNKASDGDRKIGHYYSNFLQNSCKKDGETLSSCDVLNSSLDECGTKFCESDIQPLEIGDQKVNTCDELEDKNGVLEKSNCSEKQIDIVECTRESEKTFANDSGSHEDCNKGSHQSDEGMWQKPLDCLFDVPELLSELSTDSECSSVLEINLKPNEGENVEKQPPPPKSQRKLRRKLQSVFGETDSDKSPVKIQSSTLVVKQTIINQQQEIIESDCDIPKKRQKLSRNLLSLRKTEKRMLSFASALDDVDVIELTDKTEEAQKSGECPRTDDPNFLDTIMSAMTKQAEEFKVKSPIKRFNFKAQLGPMVQVPSQPQLQEYGVGGLNMNNSGKWNEAEVPRDREDRRNRREEKKMKNIVEQEISKFLNSEMSSVQEAEEKVKACVAVLEKASVDIIASAIVSEIMTNVDEVLQEFDRPAPPLTQTQHRLMTILTVLTGSHEKFLNIGHNILDLIWSKLFPETFFWPDDSVETATRFYAALCKKMNDFKGLWRFCYKAIASMRQRWCIPILVVLQVWPDILHNATAAHDNLLVNAFVNVILHTPKIEAKRNKRQTEKLLAIKHLLINFFDFQVNTTIEEFTKKLFNSLTQDVPGSVDALILISKCRAWTWTNKNVVAKLMEIITDWTTGKETEEIGLKALEIIRQIVFMFPVAEVGTSKTAADLVAVLLRLLETKHGHEEKIVKVLCALKNHSVVKDVLLSLLTKFSDNASLHTSIRKTLTSIANPVKKRKINKKFETKREKPTKKKKKKKKKVQKGKNLPVNIGANDLDISAFTEKV